MKTNKGYPILTGFPENYSELRTPKQIDKQIEYVMANPNDRSVWLYTSHTDESQSVNSEIGGLMQEKEKTYRILDELDDITIEPQVSALRKELIKLFRKYKDFLCQVDIDGAKKTVFGDVHEDFPAEHKRDMEEGFRQHQMELRYLDWDGINVKGEEDASKILEFALTNI